MKIVGIDPFAKQHPDCNTVWVTPDGRLFRKINEKHPERRQWFEYQFDLDKDGYQHVRVNAGKRWRVHRLVYQLFVGPLNPSMVICHLDGDKTNNHCTNLLQAFQRENISHKQRHGTVLLGERHPRSKMTNDQAAFVKQALNKASRYTSGHLKRGEALRIANELGVSIHAVHDISARSKTTWSFVV